MISEINSTIRENKILISVFALLLIITSIYFLSYFPILTILGFLACLFVIILVLKIEFSVYLMAFFLPVIHWDFYISSLQIPLIDLISLLAVIAFFIRYFVLFYLGNTKNKVEKIKWPYWGAFFVFFGSALISAFFTDIILDSLWYSVRWILFFYIAYIVLPVNIINNKKILIKTLIAFILSAVVVGIMGIISLSGQDWRNEFVRIKPIAILDVFPLGQNQNLIVEVMLPAVFFVLALKNLKLSGRTQKILNLMFLFLVAVLVGTFSRGGWLAFLICLIVYIIYYYRFSLRKLAVPIFAVLILLTPILYYMYLMQTDYFIGIGSNQSRILSTQIALEAFKNKPFFGNGSGEYMNIIADNVRFRANFGDPLESHGVIQKILAENGIFGIMGFVVFVFLIFRKIIINIKNKIEERRETLFLVLLSLGGFSVFVFELFNTSYYKGKLWLPISIALVAIVILNKKKHREYVESKN